MHPCRFNKCPCKGGTILIAGLMTCKTNICLAIVINVAETHSRASRRENPEFEQEPKFSQSIFYRSAPHEKRSA